MRKGYKLGLALSGGGLRGAVHLGVLKALGDHGIYPDIVAGTSSGSLAAALYAAGANPEALIKKFESGKIWDLIDTTIPYLNWFIYFYYRIFRRFTTQSRWPLGFIKGDKLECFFDELLGQKSFKDLKIPLSVVCADIDTGETVIYCSPRVRLKRPPEDTVFISDEKIAPALRGSISLPGVFVPKNLGGRRLVDGGIKNNIPVNILYAQGARRVIAVDLGVTSQRPRPDSLVEVIMASIDIMGDELAKYIRRDYPAYYIYPDLYGVGYQDYEKIREFIRFGEEATLRVMPEIKKYLS